MKKSAITQREVWCLLGLPFDKINLTESVEHISQSINNKNKCFLSTPNLNFAIATQSDDAFFQSVLDSDLSVADGMPLIWVAKILGIPLSERVAGSTVFDQLFQQKKQTEKIKVFFFGGEKGIAKQAHLKVNENTSAMISCGFYDPGFVPVDEMSKPEIHNYINDADPDFVVVALGARKGQEWIQRNRGVLNASTISHLGAVINFVAGHVERAPAIWQQIGMEWLWRIRQEPSLWRRYFFDGLAFLKLIMLNVLPLAVYDRCLKLTESYQKPVELIVQQTDITSVRLCGSVHYGNLRGIKEMFSEILLDGNHYNVELNCEQLAYIDSAFIGSLLLFQRYLNQQGRQIILSHLSCRIRCLLNLHNVLNRFQIG